MQTEYNLEFLLENIGCYESEQIENLFPKEREVVSYEDILQSSIPLQDKYWFFCCRVFTNSQNQHLAIKIAEAVLPIFEEEYPSDNRPRKAIEAARLYLAGEIGVEELEDAVDAAWAASDAARIASAARAASRAAGAAEAAAWAAWAAGAAGAAARAASRAAGAAKAAAWAAWAAGAANPKYTKELEELLITFIEENK